MIPVEHRFKWFLQHFTLVVHGGLSRSSLAFSSMTPTEAKASIDADQGAANSYLASLQTARAELDDQRKLGTRVETETQAEVLLATGRKETVEPSATRSGSLSKG
jgi:hypothetical protein